MIKEIHKAERGPLVAAPYALPKPAAPDASAGELKTPIESAPCLGKGVELLNEYRGSGALEAQFLIRRGDGTMILISKMLHLVAMNIDGRRSIDEIAALVSGQMDRRISGDGVAYLIEQKLHPLGVMGDSPQMPREAVGPLLGFNYRRAVISPAAVQAAARTLGALFRPWVVVSVLVGVIAADIWLILRSGLNFGLQATLQQPGSVLSVLALTVVAGGFHELGHAAASQYGGAKPGAIGVGIYLLWPAFYNDLTDSYRLNRRGRLRTDLGGIYFNLVFILMLAALFAVTGINALVAAILVQHLAIVQQFVPFLRLDGYYVVTDLTGVPNLFECIKPALTGFLRRGQTKAMHALKPRVRALVITWVILTVPVLTWAAALLTVGIPDLLAATAEVIRTQGMLLANTTESRLTPEVLEATLRILMVCIQVFGLALIAGGALRRLGQLLRRSLRRRAAYAAGRLS